MMAAACKYFEEDAVYRINKKGHIEFGLILENSEFVSSDEEDSKDLKDEEWEPMKKGHVRVAWHPRGEEEVLLEKKVSLADRSLMPGDVVRRVIKGKDTQRGYCRTVDVLASVQVVGTRQVIHNVSSNDLVPLEEFSTDIAVFLDSWVGIIKMVKSKVHLRCSDGSRCVVTDDEACDLDDLLDKRDRGSEFRRYDFYPGQQLWGPMRCFENAEWLHITKEMQTLTLKPNKILRVTVESLKVMSIGVHWQCRAYSKETKVGNEPEQPKYLVQGEDLKRVKILNIFEPCTLQLGDRNYYTFKENDVLVTKEQWRRLQRDSMGPDKVVNGPENARPKEELVNGKAAKTSVQLVGGQEKIQEPAVPKSIPTELLSENDSEFEDIETDDGNTSDTASISSHSSTSSCGQGKKMKKGPALVTKILKKKKLKRARKRIYPEVVAAKPGDSVVVETLVTTSKAEVVWQDGSVEKDILSTFLYPIHHLDEHEYFPGDFVIENKDTVNPHDYGVVKQVDHSGRTTLVHWMKTYTEGSDPHPVFLNDQEVSVYDLRDHPDFKYRPGSVVIRVANFEGPQLGHMVISLLQDESTESTAGQVLDVHPTGMVEVHWVNGKRSCCYPQELYKVGEYDSDEGELWDDGDSDDSWETESEQSAITEDNIAQEAESDTVLKPKLAANIEKARSAMARLEEIFTQNPALQTATVMRQLLEVYKDCKYLDRLMGTSFFHENHFHGLLERVRERGRINSAQRVAEQVTRLFKCLPDSGGLSDTSVIPETREEVSSSSVDRTSAETVSNNNGTESSASRMLDTRAGHVCAKLCSLLKSQLLKAHEEVVRRFGGPGQEVLAQEVSPEAPDNETAASVPVEVKPSPPVLETETSKTELVEEDEPSDHSLTQGFTQLEAVPDCHKFKLTMLEPTEPKTFFRGVKKDIRLLRSSLPEGITVKGFEERMDLYSVMIKGPSRTPYEDGMFFFDFQLSPDYPKSPPICHYISYCCDRLNPNLYEDGKVCVSLLGTWGGKGTEVWTSNSSLLQVIVSIQGLILVSEPYFNEAGYERQKGTQQGKENSRMYNEMVVLKLVQAMSKLVLTPPEVFRLEIMSHFQARAYKLIRRLEKWLEISEGYNNAHPLSPTTPTVFKQVHGEDFAESSDIYLPEFPLIPASKGFCITLRKTLGYFKEVLASVGVHENAS